MKRDILNLLKNSREEEDFQMAPMIDIVFLLLIYFMVTTSLLKEEADLGIRLPGNVTQDQTLKLPDEQIVEIDPAGHVYLNGQPFDDPDSRGMPELTALLIKFRQASEAAQNPAMLTIQADPASPHQRSMDVLNAAAQARLHDVTFGE